MVLCQGMKKLLFAAVRFLLRSVLLLTAAYGFLLLRHVAGMDASIEQGLGTAQLAVVHDLFLFALPLIALSAVISLFHILNLGKLRFIARFFLMLTAASVLLGIFWGWQQFSTMNGPVTGDRFTFVSDTVYSSDQLYLLTGTIKGKSIEGVWYRSTSPGQSMVHGQYPMLEAGNRILGISETGARIPLATLNGSLESLYDSPAQAEESRIITEAGNAMKKYLDYASSSYLLMVVNALSLAISLLSLWFWVRLTRWPLWNALWAFLVCIFMYLGLVLLLEASSQALMAQLHPLVSTYAVPGYFLVLALVWSLLSLLLPPFKDWKREVGL